jgi:DNA-binding NarL/FixJ family response regulator
MAKVAPARPGGLTEREAEVLALIARGFTNREIGRALNISDRTVGSHARTIFRKVGAANRAEAAAYAERAGLVA